MANSSILQQSLFLIRACELGLITTARAREVLLAIGQRPGIEAVDWLLQAGDISSDDAVRLVDPSGADTLPDLGEDGVPSTASAQPPMQNSLPATQDWTGDIGSWPTATYDIATEAHQGDASADPTLGSSRFRLIRPLAEGGLGVVSVAEDRQLQREVALKQMQGKLAKDIGLQRKFVFEAEVTGRLEHPSIVPIYALGVDASGNPYYAMRLIQGLDLRAHIRQHHARVQAGEISLNGSELRQLLRRFLDVCNAISYAHERGILHRDLKPGNIMLGNFGETFVVDWGLAKSIAWKSTDPSGVIHPSAHPSDGTIIGQFMGTPAYAPPEQLRGLIDQLDQRSDIYSLGVILYEILVGRPPVTEGHPYDLAARLDKFGTPTANSQSSHVPRSLSAIAQKAMEASMDARYQDVKSLRSDVEAWLDDLSVSSYRESVVEKAARWFRKNRAASLITALASLIIALTASIGLVSYRAIAQVAHQREQTALVADQNSRNMLRTASLLELETANQLIRTSYTDEAELSRASHPGYKSHWHLGATRLLQAIKLDPSNREAKIRLFSTLVHQGLARRDLPSTIQPRSFEVDPQYSVDGQVMAWVKSDQSLWLCQLNRGLDASDRIPVSGRVYAFCLNADGSRLAVELENGLRLIDTQTLRTTLELPERNKLPIVFDKQSKLVGLVDRESRELFRWHVTDNRLEKLSELKPARSQLVASSATASSMLTHQFDRVFQWSDFATAKQYATHAMSTTGTDTQPYAFLPKKSGLLLGTELGLVVLYEPKPDGQLASRVLVRNEFACTALAVSPDGDRCVIGYNNGEIEIFDLVQGSVIHKLPRQHYTISALRFSPDGLLVMSAAGEMLRVWNALTGNPVTEPWHYPGSTRDACFSYDSTRLVAWSDQGGLREYRVNDGGPTQLYLRQPGVSLQYEFSPNEEILASTSYQAYQQFTYNRLNHVDWSLVDLKPIRARPIRNYNSYPESLISPSGRLAMTYDMSGSMQIWEIASGKLLQTFCAARLAGGSGQSKQIKRVFWSKDEQLVGCVTGQVWFAKDDDPEACELWDWRQGQRIWNSAEAIGGAGLVTVRDDWLLCAKQEDDRLKLASYSLSTRQLRANSSLDNLSRVVAIEALADGEHCVMLSQDRSGQSNCRLHKLKVGTTQPQRQTLEFKPNTSVRFVRDTRDPSNRLLAVAGMAVVDLDHWRVQELGSTKPAEFETISFCAGRDLLISSANAELRSRFWHVQTGKPAFEANQNGLAVAGPLGDMITVSHPLSTLAPLLDQSARYEIEEPIETGVPKTVKLASLAKFSPKGKLLALQAERGLIVRELLSPELKKSIVEVPPAELDWIESWIGLRVHERGSYEVIPVDQRWDAVHHAQTTSTPWMQLHAWLTEDVSVRTLTPASGIMARDVNFACGLSEELHDLCDAYHHCSDDGLIALRIAHCLAKSTEHQTRYAALISHLAQRADAGADNLDPVTICRRLRLRLPIKSEADAAAKLRSCHDLITALQQNSPDSMDGWYFRELAIACQQLLSDLRADVSLAVPIQAELDQIVVHMSSHANSIAENMPAPFLEARDILLREIAIFKLEPIAQAIEAEQWESAEQQVRSLEAISEMPGVAAEARGLLSVFRQPPKELIAPDQCPTSHSELKLIEARRKLVGEESPRNMKVDRIFRCNGMPTINALPAPDPTTLVYTLGGKWKNFTGEVGLQSGPAQQLIFEVHGDGKPLWTSQAIFQDQAQTFNIVVKDVNELKLITKGVPNGDWRNPAVWISPLLNR